jgi:hypothetical protein
MHVAYSPVAKQFILENASPSTRLLEKRRQMFEVQEALELQKQEFARKVWCINMTVGRERQAEEQQTHGNC